MNKTFAVFLMGICFAGGLILGVFVASHHLQKVRNEELRQELTKNLLASTSPLQHILQGQTEWAITNLEWALDIALQEYSLHEKEIGLDKNSKCVDLFNFSKQIRQDAENRNQKGIQPKPEGDGVKHAAP